MMMNHLISLVYPLAPVIVQFLVHPVFPEVGLFGGGLRVAVSIHTYRSCATATARILLPTVLHSTAPPSGQTNPRCACCRYG